LKIIEEEKKYLDLFENEMQYASLSARFVEHYFEYGKTKNKHLLKKMNTLIKNPFLQDESKAVTFRSKMRLHEAHLFHNSAQSNDKGTYNTLLKLTSLFDSHPEKIKQYSVNYMNNLYNLIEASITLKKYRLVPAYLEKLKATSGSLTNKFSKERYFILYTSSSLMFYNETGQFEKSKKEIDKAISELKEYETKLPDIEKAMIWFQFAFYYFGTDHFAKCLFWLNKIRNELSLDLLPDLQTEIKIFYLIVHYEMGNAELVPDLVQSLFRFLIKKERLLEFEKLILLFLKKLPYVTGDQNLIRVYKELKKRIDALPEKTAHSHFDLLSWIESKIENRSFAGIIREKMNDK
jgi:tetratricopeptide (TPR) repeat protein